MPDAVIVDAVRSPMGRGKQGGALSGVHPVDLLAAVLPGWWSAPASTPAPSTTSWSAAWARPASSRPPPAGRPWLAAGYPVHVPSVTIERKCGSGQQALDFAVQGIVAGAYDIVIAAGVESMSRVPMGIGPDGRRPATAPASARGSPASCPQGVSAELVADKWGLSRRAARRVRRALARARRGDRGGGRLRRRDRAGDDPGRATVVSPTRRSAPAPPSRSSARSSPRSRTEEMHEPLPATRLEDHRRQLLPDHRRRRRAAGHERGAGRRARAARRGPASSPRPSSATTRCSCSPARSRRRAKVLARAGLTHRPTSTPFEVNEAFAPVPLAWQAEFGRRRRAAQPARRRDRPRPPARRLRRPADDHPARTTSSTPAAGTGCRRCARPAAWPTPPSSSGSAERRRPTWKEPTWTSTGSSAVVTGGASGLGLATARRLIERGVRRRDHRPAHLRRARRWPPSSATWPASSPPTSPTPTAVDRGAGRRRRRGRRCARSCTAPAAAARSASSTRTAHPGDHDLYEQIVRHQPRRHLQRAAAGRRADGRATSRSTASAASCVLTASVAAFEGQIGQLPYASAKAGIVGHDAGRRPRPAPDS